MLVTHVKLFPEHPRVVPADGAALLAPGGRVGGAAQALPLPTDRLHSLIRHRRAVHTG